MFQTQRTIVCSAILATGLGLGFTGNAFAQYPGGGTGGGTTVTGGMTGGATGGTTGAAGGTTGGMMGGYGGATGGMTGAASAGGFHQNYHIGFDRPEAWGLKYFTSSSLLNGLQPEEPSPEGRRVGSVTVGFETGWIPQLDAGQQRIGFNGRAPEDLNKAPVFARPIVRVTLPAKFTLVAAAPPPFEIFGVTPHLVAFGVERPIVERAQWRVGWRGYGQLGTVEGAFTCPKSVLMFAPGSPENPTRCVGESADVATLRYAGLEIQFAHRLSRAPRVVPHVAVAGNFMDGAFQVHAPVTGGLDETRLWTRGGTFSTTGGATFLVTKRAAFTVDAFYTPLWVERSAGAPRTLDGLFNVRALLSYTFR